jgi:hypothetical protein
MRLLTFCMLHGLIGQCNTRLSINGFIIISQAQLQAHKRLTFLNFINDESKLLENIKKKKKKLTLFLSFS